MMEIFHKEAQKNENQSIWVGTEYRHILYIIPWERRGMGSGVLPYSQANQLAYYYAMGVYRKHFPWPKRVDFTITQLVALAPCVFIGSLAPCVFIGSLVSLSLMDPDGYGAHSTILYNTAEGHRVWRTQPGCPLSGERCDLMT